MSENTSFWPFGNASHLRLIRLPWHLEDKSLPHTIRHPLEGRPLPHFVELDQNCCFLHDTDLYGSWSVIFLTPSSTLFKGWRETMGFARMLDRFEALEARVIGVNHDTLKFNQEFTRLKGLEFSLISTWPNKRLFSVLGAVNEYGKPKRMTLLVDPQGKVRKVFTQVRVKHHAREVLTELKRLKEAVDDPF